MNESASLSIAAVMLRPVELLAELGLVIDWDVDALLQLVSTVSECTLN